MKAAILKNWRQIELGDIAAPVPGPGEVLINVSLAGICGSDAHIYNGDNPIAFTPVVPGHEFTGRIVALGKGVKSVKLNVRVAIQPLKFCGSCTACERGMPHVCENLIVIGVNQNGGFAEQVVVPIDCVFPIPESLADETATLAEPFSVATHSLRRGQISPSDRVLIIGAGPIGFYCALTARYMGVQKVCISEPNPDRREAAERFDFTTIDPVTDDAVGNARSLSENKGFDLVIDTSGSAAGLAFATEAAAVQGRIVVLGFPAGGACDVHITRCIIKELSLIGSRVCTRKEFQETLEMLTTFQSDEEMDFQNLIAATRPLAELDRSILDVERGLESRKILIKPV